MNTLTDIARRSLIAITLHDMKTANAPAHSLESHAFLDCVSQRMPKTPESNYYLNCTESQFDALIKDVTAQRLQALRNWRGYELI